MNRLKLSVFLLLFVSINIFSQEKKYTTYEAQEGETIQTISQKFSITPYNLIQLNPDIKEGVSQGQLIIVPNKNYKPEAINEKGDYLKDGFLYHRVKPKENYFRLKQEYGVSKRDLRKHNLELRSGDLKAGQLIKIPVNKNFKLEIRTKETAKTKPYLVRPKETKYSISRRYGITVEELEELNPHLKENELKIAEIIKIPDVEELTDLDIDENYVTHQVEKGETFFSLGQKFKISQEELIQHNPELEEGVKEGMLIKIPRASFNESTHTFVANIPENKQLNMLMMLPFTTNKEELDFEKDRTLNIATDFYLGALMALDSLKEQGLSVSMKVYDTQNSKNVVSNILRMNDLKQVDVLVGPMYLDNLKLVSQSLYQDSLAVISPASSKDHSGFARWNVVKEIPSDKLLSEKVLEYIKANHKGKNIIVVIDDQKENQVEFKKTIEELNALDSIQKVTVLKPEKGYIRPDLFKSNVNEDQENWVVLLTKDDVITADAVHNFGVLPEEINISMFSLNYNRSFEKLENNFLARINFHYPVFSFIDIEDPKVITFIEKYKKMNYAEPSEYAFRGFDMVYDALLRLATYTNTKDAFSGGISQRLSNRFYYTQKPGKCFENKGVFLIKYEGLELKKVE